jgi:hypothetical protein
MDFLERSKSPRVRSAAAIAGALLALWALVGFFALPAVLRPVVERKIGEALHRKATLRGMKINPFTLSVTLRGVDVRDRDGTGPFLSLEALYVNVEASSIFRGGPVLSAIRLVKPRVSLVRNADESYSVQDLIEELSKPTPSPKDGKPLRFSFNNIRLEGGSIDFDDRPKKTKHEIRDLTIGIPFLSNIPSKVEITTLPVFAAKVNGSPFEARGRTRPFSETRETTLNVDLTDVDLPFYLAYAPQKIAPQVRSARLDARLVLAFTQPLKGPPALVVSGTAALRKVAVEQGGEPLLAWERFDADAEAIDVFGRSAKLRSLKLTAPEVWIRRHTMPEHDIANALAAPGKTKVASMGEEGRVAPASPVAADKPFPVRLAEAAIFGGVVHYDDFAFRPSFHAVLSDVAVSVKGFSTASGKPAAFEISAKSDAGEVFRCAGTLSMDSAAVAVAGSLSLDGAPLKRYTTFLEELVPVSIDDGVLTLKTGYSFSAGQSGNTVLSDLAISVTSPRLRRKSEREPFFRAAALAMTGSTLDVAKRSFVLGDLTSTAGILTVVREKDGNADLMKLGPKPNPDAPPPPPPSSPWDVTLKRVALHGYTVKMDDRSLTRPARYALTKADVVLENLSTARGSKGALAVTFGVDGKGVASARGTVGFKPMFADLRVDVKNIDLVPIESYVLQNLRLDLARGSVSAAGRIAIREDTDGKASIVYTGDALVANLLAVDEATQLDFLKWDVFSATGMRAGYNPLFLEVKQLGAVGPACDIAIEADGTVNLRKIVGAPSPKDDDEDAASPPADVAPVPSPPPAPEISAAGAQGEKVPGPAMPVRIDEITLQGGRIGLTDRLVKPNFAATLGDLGGRVTGLSSADGTVAALDLRGSLAGHSPLQVTGTINPLAAANFADVRASFRNIDLPAFTPYSGTYAGYAIASGSLTVEVAYRVENRKLTASNRLLLNQFDFGDKVESKQATKLPVRFTVSLLKDKDGVIDLDLPIEGSLDDPKFRLGRIVWKVLGNLIAKAATAPFALLGKLLGGGKGDELSAVDFPDGLATLDDAGRRKLDTLAKALKDRPALTLQATGRFSGDKDLEGLRAARVERKIRAQKLAGLAKKGTAPPGVDDVMVEAAEREAYLKQAYKREKFPKPRTPLGFAKDLPAGEMEKLMLANEAVGDADLRQLAFSRASAVKDYLTGPGAVDPARVFVLEPGAQAAPPSEKLRPSRVDLSLK